MKFNKVSLFCFCIAVLLSLGMISYSSGYYPVFAACKCTNGGGVACSDCKPGGTPQNCTCTFIRSEDHATAVSSLVP